MAVSRSFREHLKPLLGLGFIVVLLVMAWGTVLSYQKALPWQHTTAVTLSTTSAGLGLTPPSDVKLQGLRVGEVREVSTDGRAAVLHIALDPHRIGMIPANVDAAIIPKTLFGEKYVDLRLPERPSAEHIVAGARIAQSQTSVEIGLLFNNLRATLDTLKPEQLSVTLNSVADALQGRGADLGETLELLHTYLARFNPHLDTMTGDLRKTADTADVYSAAAGDLVRVLDNSRVISTELLGPKERSFESFLQRSIEAADTMSDVLAANGRDIVTLAGRQRPILEVLATYAPEIPCLADALVKNNRAANSALGGQGPYLKATIDLFVDRPSYRNGEDSSSNPESDANNRTLPPGITSWDPHCPEIPERYEQLEDTPAYNAADKPARAQQRAAAAAAEPKRRTPTLAGALAARLMDRPAEQVPPIAELMLAPMLRGGEVRVP